MSDIISGVGVWPFGLRLPSYLRTGFQLLNLGQATKFKFSYSIIDIIMHVCCKSHLEKLM